MELGTQPSHSSAPLEGRLPPSSRWHVVYSASTSSLSWAPVGPRGPEPPTGWRRRQRGEGLGYWAGFGGKS